MARYFLEVGYRGTGYSGFQVQQNARTVLGELERALAILFQEEIRLTGSSRTDAGVHARQNYAHVDLNRDLPAHILYQVNALLPWDIVVKGIYGTQPNAHARYDALSRTYRYALYRSKDPFLHEFGYYYPYCLDPEVLQETARLIGTWQDFAAFAKRNPQAKTYQCEVQEARWTPGPGLWHFTITANRFLRGMVRGLVGTQLLAARGRITMTRFREIADSGDAARADFSVPPQGLFLEEVRYPSGFLVPLRLPGPEPGA